MIRDLMVSALHDADLRDAITSVYEDILSHGLELSAPKHLMIDLTTQAIVQAVSAIGDSIEHHSRLAAGDDLLTELLMARIVGGFLERANKVLGESVSMLGARHGG